MSFEDQHPGDTEESYYRGMAEADAAKRTPINLAALRALCDAAKDGEPMRVRLGRGRTDAFLDAESSMIEDPAPLAYEAVYMRDTVRGLLDTLETAQKQAHNRMIACETGARALTDAMDKIERLRGALTRATNSLHSCFHEFTAEQALRCDLGGSYQDARAALEAQP